MNNQARAYYNENDLFAAEWLKELIRKGKIADGDVDSRSIEEVKPNELRGYTQYHFFAGIGGWSLALRRAGWPDDRPVWTGSCPCQPFSGAGKGGGTSDERHLWPAWFHLISQQCPGVILGEQVASQDGLGWLDLIQTDLEAAGYASGAVDICAAGFGSPQVRQRLYFVAERLGYRDDARLEVWRGRSYEEPGPKGREASERLAGLPGVHGGNAGPEGSTRKTHGFWRDADWIRCSDDCWRPVEPGTSPLAHGVPSRVGRVRGYGNAISPPTAQAFIEAYLESYPLSQSKDANSNAR